MSSKHNCTVLLTYSAEFLILLNDRHERLLQARLLIHCVSEQELVIPRLLGVNVGVLQITTLMVPQMTN
eukprot:1159015-Pelagomonas_calceolata.AAC.6